MGFFDNPVYVALALAVAYFLITKLLTSIRLSKFAREHGTKPPRQIPQSERILGLDLFLSRLREAKGKRLLESAQKRFEANGPTWTSCTLGETIFLTVDPENIKAVLATNFKDYGLGKRLEIFGVLLGAGIFTVDGTHWEHSRAMIRPSFTKAQVADLDALETHVQHFIDDLPRDGSTVDLQPLFFNLTLDYATEFLFGESVDSLLPNSSPANKAFAQSFDSAQLQVANRSRLGPLGPYLPNAKLKRSCEVVHAFVDRFVHKAVAYQKDLQAGGKLGDQEKRVRDDEEKSRYVFLDELAKETVNPKQLRDELLNILLAGRDTTASLLSNTFIVLARRPDVWKKLRAEVEELGGDKPDYSTMRDMKYLKFVLNESLRLYPVVPSNARFSNKDTVLPRGGGPDGQAPIMVPKNAPVIYNVYAMHRRRDIYGEDSNEFKPERWETIRPGWAYLPFNGGPRICVGQQFALTEASYTIVRIIQEFPNIESRDSEPWTEHFHLTLSSANGTKVALTPS